MIDTSKLTNLDLCLVTLGLGQDDEDGGESKEIFCIFINGVFQNLTEDHHCYEVYGGSVIKFRKLHSAHSLMKILVDKLWIAAKETKKRTD